MNNEHSPVPPRSDNLLTSVGVDHVRLSYCYLNDGDLDAYCSLFAEQAVVRQPGRRPVTGRQELERVERARRATRSIRHSIYEVFGSGRKVAALGLLTHRRHTPGHTESDLPFVDVFTVADNGLLVDRTTFLFSPGSSLCSAE
jgi:ketosteroid isomerase-like protein